MLNARTGFTGRTLMTSAVPPSCVCTCAQSYILLAISRDTSPVAIDIACIIWCISSREFHVSTSCVIACRDRFCVVPVCWASCSNCCWLLSSLFTHLEVGFPGYGWTGKRCVCVEEGCQIILVERGVTILAVLNLHLYVNMVAQFV